MCVHLPDKSFEWYKQDAVPPRVGYNIPLLYESKNRLRSLRTDAIIIILKKTLQSKKHFLERSRLFAAPMSLRINKSVFWTTDRNQTTLT